MQPSTPQQMPTPASPLLMHAPDAQPLSSAHAPPGPTRQRPSALQASASSQPGAGPGGRGTQMPGWSGLAHVSQGPHELCSQHAPSVQNTPMPHDSALVQAWPKMRSCHVSDICCSVSLRVPPVKSRPPLSGLFVKTAPLRRTGGSTRSSSVMALTGRMTGPTSPRSSVASVPLPPANSVSAVVGANAIEQPERNPDFRAPVAVQLVPLNDQMS